MSIHQKKRFDKPVDGKVVVNAHGSDTAPFIFFDGAVAMGTIGGVVQIELAATVRIPVTVNGKQEVRTRTIIVGHLRATHQMMGQLGDAIEKALMITGPLDRNATKEKEDVQS